MFSKKPKKLAPQPEEIEMQEFHSMGSSQVGSGEREHDFHPMLLDLVIPPIVLPPMPSFTLNLAELSASVQADIQARLAAIENSHTALLSSFNPPALYTVPGPFAQFFTQMPQYDFTQWDYQPPPPPAPAPAAQDSDYESDDAGSEFNF